jgi:hypothetical protein
MPDLEVPKDQGESRRWSYLPWTREMEESSRTENPTGLKVKLRGFRSAFDGDRKGTAGTSSTKQKSKKQKRK